MTVIETKADELMVLIDEKHKLTTKEASTIMNVPEAYIRKLAIALERNKLIALDASAFSLTMVSLTPAVSSERSSSPQESF